MYTLDILRGQPIDLIQVRGTVENRREFKLGKTIITRQRAASAFCCVLFISQGMTAVLLVLPHTVPLQVVSTS